MAEVHLRRSFLTFAHFHDEEIAKVFAVDLLLAWILW